MLTSEDLEQIGKVIDGRIEPIKQDLAAVKAELQAQGKDIKGLRKDMRKVKKDVSVLIKSTNRDDMNLTKRVQRIEHHIGIPTAN